MSEIDFLEACYRPAGAREWARGLRDAAVGIFSSQLAVTVSGYGVSPEGKIVEPWAENTQSVDELVERGWNHPRGWAETLNHSKLGGQFVRASLGAPSPSVAIMRRMPGALTPFGLDLIPTTCADALGLLAGLASDRSLVVAWLTQHPIELGRGARAHWHSVAEHLAAAHAIRALEPPAPETAAAVISVGGRVLAADDAAAAPATRSRFADAVKRMDRARTRHRKATQEEAVGLWRAFVEGQYSLVEWSDRDGRRTILAVRVHSDVRALTPRERAVARLAAEGASNKVIAAALGLSMSTVSTDLRRALRKLGCRTRTALAGLIWSPSSAPEQRTSTRDETNSELSQER